MTHDIAAAVEKRSFTVAPSIIMNLIRAQAGSLAKGVLESIMNSVDAGATQVDITTGTHQIVIKDDGRGFSSRKQIEDWFEVFGFDHSNMDVRFGFFGIGRGQMFSFSTNIWRTHAFEMRVDIKTKGLDYDLVENLPDVPGMTITADLYEPMTTSELIAFERELKELCKYAEIPVLVNGKRINKDPSKEKWTHDTAEAWIKLSTTSRELSVYNRGIKIRDYPAYQFSTGGIVVTKPGVRLQLSMSRTDILVALCPVWKKIKPFLREEGAKAAKRSARLTEDQLGSFAEQFLAGELSLYEFDKYRPITDILGRRITVDSFLRATEGTTDRVLTWCDKSTANAVVEASHRERHCFVLNARTLSIFGVDSATELVEALQQTFEQHGQRWLAERLGKRRTFTVEDDWKRACRKMSDSHTELPMKQWTKVETAAVRALQAAMRELAVTLVSAGVTEASGPVQPRVVRIGLADASDAWTDGKRTVWINRSLLPRMRHGLAGVASIIHVLVHELLHEDDSTDTHLHDLDFYARFEQVLCHYDEPLHRNCVGEATRVAMAEYLKACQALDTRATQMVEKHSDLADRAALRAEMV